MKVRFIHFEIAKYGGIIEEIEHRILAFKKLGWDADVIRLTYSEDENIKSFLKKKGEMEDGIFDNKLTYHSQNRGYEKSKITGHWKNPYYGWLLEPYKNLIPTRHPEGIKMFREALKDVDLVFWSFMPTKTAEAKGFSDWWKFFDLPKSTKQVFIVHDGYFDKRSSWISALSDKITYLDCVHLASYNCCSNIAIPRKLTISPRIFPEQMFVRRKEERDVHFFSAHIFKSMKRMDELIRAIPYIPIEYSVVVAGNDIEYNYMTSEDKVKPNYIARKNEDPDLDESQFGKKIWDRAVEHDMLYMGLLPNTQVHEMQRMSQFFIDPSWCTHYAEYNRTNINSSLIEAAINGCYPVIRDYKGLEKHKKYEEDEIFNKLKAVVIPWNATPKQFAEYLVKAERMSEQQFLEDTLSNFELFKSLSDAEINTKQILDIVYKGTEGLSKGQNSKKVLEQTEDVMKNFFEINLPIKWEN